MFSKVHVLKTVRESEGKTEEQSKTNGGTASRSGLVFSVSKTGEWSSFSGACI